MGLLDFDSLSFYFPKEDMHLDGKNTDFSTLPHHCWGFLTIFWTDHILISVFITLCLRHSVSIQGVNTSHSSDFSDVDVCSQELQS